MCCDQFTSTQFSVQWSKAYHSNYPCNKKKIMNNKIEGLQQEFSLDKKTKTKNICFPVSLNCATVSNITKGVFSLSMRVYMGWKKGQRMGVCVCGCVCVWGGDHNCSSIMFKYSHRPNQRKLQVDLYSDASLSRVWNSTKAFLKYTVIPCHCPTSAQPDLQS